jgi:acyl carrier protein
LGVTAAITALICALYAHVLGRPTVRPDDDFFADLNGDSLAAAQVIVAVDDIFKINVIDEFFADSRASCIARLLEPHVYSRMTTGQPWADGSPLLGGALNDELARMRRSLPPVRDGVVE